MNRRIIILGANGFIGGWLWRRFSEGREYKTLGFSSADCNLLSAASLEQALADLHRDDVMVMASAITRLRANTFEAMLANIQMVENLCRFLMRRPVAQLIYLSSVDVYGCLERKFRRRKTLINETFELKPDDYYGIGKVISELILKNRLSDRGVAVTVLRLSGVFGPGDKQQSLIARFIQAVIQQGRVTIYGDGQDRRDYLYVDDVYTAVAKAIECRLQDTVNVVSGHSYSIVEIVGIIKSLTQCPCEIKFKKIEHPLKERIKDMRFDNAYLQKVLVGVSLHDLSWGIAQYLKASGKTGGTEQGSRLLASRQSPGPVWQAVCV